MTEAEVRELLRAACEKGGGQRPWALAHGISPQHVNAVVLAGRKPPGAVIRAALGIEAVVRYRRVRG